MLNDPANRAAVAQLYEWDITRNMRPEVNIYTYRTPDTCLAPPRTGAKVSVATRLPSGRPHWAWKPGIYHPSRKRGRFRFEHTQQLGG